MKTAIFDIETDGLLDEMTRIHCLVIEDAGTGEVKVYNNTTKPNGNIDEGVAALGCYDVLVGHNIISFDIPALRKLYPSFSSDISRVLDTYVAAQLIYPQVAKLDFSPNSPVPGKLKKRHTLAAWGYRLGVLKGDFCATSDWKEWSQDMEDYCKQDVAVTAALYARIAKRLEDNEGIKRALETEQRFAELIHMQETNGVGFDEAACESLVAELTKRRSGIVDKLRSVIPPDYEVMKQPEYYVCNGEKFKTKKEARKAYGAKAEIVDGPPRKKPILFNPASGDQVAKYFISKYGWKPEAFTASGRPEITEAVLKGLDYPEAKDILEFLLVSKVLGMAAEGPTAWLKELRDGRIHGRVKTLGAVTRRCTHASPNLAQVPRVGSFMGKECRSLFRPTRPGWKQVGWDASGLELRMFAHYVGRWDNGEYAKLLLEEDIHTVNQKAAGLPTRNDAKTFIYAFLYGAGDEKLGSIVGSGAKAGKALRSKFLKELPALNELVKAVKQRAQTGWLASIDGAPLMVRSQHSALNTLLQSAGAIVMKNAALVQRDILENEHGLKPGEDFAWMLNIHDEIQMECRPDVADIVAASGPEAIRRVGEMFHLRCPLDGEAKVGDNWSETH